MIFFESPTVFARWVGQVRKIFLSVLVGEIGFVEGADAMVNLMATTNRTDHVVLEIVSACFNGSHYALVAKPLANIVIILWLIANRTRSIVIDELVRSRSHICGI